MEIGVRELKAHLSAVLERVAGGEVVTITDRGQPKAMLTPPPRPDGALARGVAEGWIRPAPSAGLGPVARQRGRHRVIDVLDEDRAGDGDET